MGYLLREEPLTIKEIKAKSADNFIEEVIPVELQTIIDHDFVGLMDIFEGLLLGDQGILTDVGYEVVGSGLATSGSGGIVHIKVYGYADLVGEDDPLAIGEG